MKTRITELFGIEHPIVSVGHELDQRAPDGGGRLQRRRPRDPGDRAAGRRADAAGDPGDPEPDRQALRRERHAALPGRGREREGPAGREGAGDQLRPGQGRLDREGGPRVRREGDRDRRQRPPREARPGLRGGRGDRDRPRGGRPRGGDRPSFVLIPSLADVLDDTGDRRGRYRRRPGRWRRPWPLARKGWRWAAAS